MSQLWKTVQPQVGRAVVYLRDVFWPALPQPTPTASEGDSEPALSASAARKPTAVPTPVAPVEAGTAPEPLDESVSETGEGDSRVLDLLKASTLTERRALAKQHPELRPPYSFFDDDINEQLSQVLWGGVSLAKAEATQEDIQRALETLYARSKMKALEPYRPDQRS